MGVTSGRGRRRRCARLAAALALVFGGHASAQDAEPPESAAAGAPAGAAVPAAEPSAEVKPGLLDRLEVAVLVDAYYGYNFDDPAADNLLRNFDTKHDQFSLNLAEIFIEQKPTPEGRLGFRIDQDFGPATEMVHAAEPGGEIFEQFQQGYLSYLAPLGRGLQVDVGKFVTPHGAEVIETKDNWNYSRSLLFAWAIPYYHFGLRAAYPLSNQLTVTGYLVNGWNNVVENNGGRTVGLQAVWKPSSAVTVAQSYMTGPEQAIGGGPRRHLFDTVLTVAPASWLTLMANYDHGTDSTAEGAGVRWQGAALYAKVAPSPKWALAVRVERFDDGDGFATGVPQVLEEWTLTAERAVAEGLLARLEMRRDLSDADVFPQAAGPAARTQTTLTFGLAYGWSSKSLRP